MKLPLPVRAYELVLGLPLLSSSSGFLFTAHFVACVFFIAFPSRACIEFIDCMQILPQLIKYTECESDDEDAKGRQDKDGED